MVETVTWIYPLLVLKKKHIRSVQLILPIFRHIDWKLYLVLSLPIVYNRKWKIHTWMVYIPNAITPGHLDKKKKLR